MSTQTEQKTTHTPDPWTFDDGDDPDFGESVIEIEHLGVPVASVYGSLDFPCADAEQEAEVKAESRANAYLIAAAPELLRVCRRVALHTQASGGYIGRNGQLLKEVLAAIAKAEGKV